MTEREQRVDLLAVEPAIADVDTFGILRTLCPAPRRSLRMSRIRRGSIFEAPPAGVDFAVRALADFQRITLRPGEAKSVLLHIAPDRLRYWSVVDSAWHIASGARTVYVGASSRDLRLRQRVRRTTS